LSYTAEARHQHHRCVPEQAPATQCDYALNPCRKCISKLLQRPHPQCRYNRAQAPQVVEIRSLECTEHIPSHGQCDTQIVHKITLGSHQIAFFFVRNTGSAYSSSGSTSTSTYAWVGWGRTTR